MEGGRKGRTEEVAQACNSVAREVGTGRSLGLNDHLPIFYSSLFGKFQFSKRHCLGKKMADAPHLPKLHFLGVKKKGSFFFFFNPTVSLLAPWKHLILISHEETEAF